MPRQIITHIDPGRLHGHHRVLYAAKAKSAVKREAEIERQLSAQVARLEARCRRRYCKPQNWRRAYASVADADDSLPPTPKTMQEARNGPNAAEWEKALL